MVISADLWLFEFIVDTNKVSSHSEKMYVAVKPNREMTSVAVAADSLLKICEELGKNDITIISSRFCYSVERLSEIDSV